MTFQQMPTSQALALQQRYGTSIPGAYVPQNAPAPQPDYWRPAAMDRPPVAYPAYSFDQSASDGVDSRKPYKGTFAQRYNKMRGNDQISITPGSPMANAGTGSYMGPGSHAADQLWQQQTATAMAQAHARKTGGGLTPGGYTTAGGGGGGYGGGGSGGGGGYGGGSPSELAREYQRAMDRANQENEARYQDVLGGTQARYERGMGMLEGAGNQERQDINEAYDASGAAMRQGLVSRGLNNSTILDTMQMGNQRERTASLGRLNDRLIQQRLAQDANLSGDVLNFMERKTETGPDLNQLIQLEQLLGAGNVGNGGAGGGAYMAGPPIYQSPGAIGYQIPTMGSVAMGGGSYNSGRSGGATMNMMIRRAMEVAGRPAARAAGIAGMAKEAELIKADRARAALADALLGGPVIF